MDAVVDLGEGALEVPVELETVVFVVLEALEFLDEVESKFDRDPRGEFEGDIFLGEGAAVAARARGDSYGSSFFEPLFWGKNEAVQTGLHSNPVEFDGIKTWVVKPLPDAEELDCAAAAQPIANYIVRVIGIFQFCNVGQAKEILLIVRENPDGCSLNFDSGAFGFAHVVGVAIYRASGGMIEITVGFK